MFSSVCSSFARSWNRPCQREHAQGMPSWARSAFANSVSDVYASSTHAPYPALAPLQLSQRQPVCQLCRERQPVRDIGLNLDQCRGVRSHSKNCCTVYPSNLIHEFASFFSTKVIYEGLPRKALPWKQEKVDTGRTPSRKQQPRFAQDQPEWYFWKNLKEQLQLNLLLEWMLNERWRRLSVQTSTCQHVAAIQFVSCAEKYSLCGTVVMAWIWHVWINAMVCVPMTEAPPKAGTKQLLYSLPSKFNSWVYILLFDEGDFCRFA